MRFKSWATLNYLNLCHFLGSDQPVIELCQFPEERCSSTVIVTSEDYRSLEEGEYVNDTIIDFYLTYLHNQVLNKEDRDNVYVFRLIYILLYI